MDQIKAINRNAFDISTYGILLVSAHMIPGTDYRFMLEMCDSQFVYLRNAETG